MDGSGEEGGGVSGGKKGVQEQLSKGAKANLFLLLGEGRRSARHATRPGRAGSRPRGPARGGHTSAQSGAVRQRAREGGVGSRCRSRGTIARCGGGSEVSAAAALPLSLHLPASGDRCAREGRNQRFFSGADSFFSFFLE